MLRLIFLLPLLVIFVPMLLVAFALGLVFRGDPGACGGGRDLIVDAALADAYQERWLEFQRQLSLGQPASFVVNDSEATSQALDFLADADAPIEDLRFCIVPDGADVNGTVSTPFGPDVAVRVKGSADLAGDHPRAQIDSITFGALPAVVTSPFTGLVTRIIDDQLQRIFLDHRLTIEVHDGQVIIHGQP